MEATLIGDPSKSDALQLLLTIKQEVPLAPDRDANAQY